MTHQCEALLICSTPNVRCPSSAYARVLTSTNYGGHRLCWVHYQAAANPERNEALRFVEQEVRHG